MPSSASIARLRRLSAATVEPILSDDDLAAILADHRRADRDGNPPNAFAAWRASTAYGAGAIVVPDPRNGFSYEATVAGTSGASTPTWPTTIGATVVDGGVTWRCDARAPWVESYDVNAAAAEAWETKAGLASADVAFTADGATFHPEQTAKFCQEKAGEFRKRVYGSASIRDVDPADEVWP